MYTYIYIYSVIHTYAYIRMCLHAYRGLLHWVFWAVWAVSIRKVELDDIGKYSRLPYVVEFFGGPLSLLTRRVERVETITLPALAHVPLVQRQQAADAKLANPKQCKTTGP